MCEDLGKGEKIEKQRQLLELDFISSAEPRPSSESTYSGIVHPREH